MIRRDAFPPLRELPAMFACYALIAVLAWLVTHPREFVAIVTGGGHVG